METDAPGFASVGFVGVGTLATAMVRGLRARWPDLVVHLSPRSEQVSASLAAADPRVLRAASNAAVVAASNLVVLSMRPPHFKEAVRGLPFRAGQLVLSCLTGISLDELRAQCGPATVARALPLPMIERGEGPLVICPPEPRVVSLFDGLGDTIAVADEAALLALWPGSTVMSSYFALQGAITEWMIARGAEPVAAALYVRSLMRALGETGARNRSLPTEVATERLITEHETLGGLNYRVRSQLLKGGWFTAVGAALDANLALRAHELTSSADS